MSGSTKIDSAFLVKYKDQLDEVFRTYIEDINPFIVKFESQKNVFPVEVSLGPDPNVVNLSNLTVWQILKLEF